jgi:hypothetical protein
MSILSTFVNKCLSLNRFGENWNNKLIQSVVEAVRTISYVETYNPEQSDTFHLAIKRSDNRTFMHEFENVVRFAIAKLNLKNKRIKMVFDTTEEVTWTKYNFNLRPSVYDKPLYCWNILNVSIVEPEFLPLMSIPYRQIDNLDLLVIDLLKYIKTLPIIVDLVLFDRGFFHAHLIDYLNNKKGGSPWPYLMLVPERKPQQDNIKQTRDSGKLFAYYKHIFDYSKDKSKWQPSTTIMVKIVDEETAWCYATNLKPSLYLCSQYPKRWCIETGFRVHDEARIKSKSPFMKIRFFYHLIGMLMIILWKLQNTINEYAFKKYLEFIDYQFIKKLNLLGPPT